MSQNVLQVEQPQKQHTKENQEFYSTAKPDESCDKFCKKCETCILAPFNVLCIPVDCCVKNCCQHQDDERCWGTIGSACFTAGAIVGCVFCVKAVF